MPPLNVQASKCYLSFSLYNFFFAAMNIFMIFIVEME